MEKKAAVHALIFGEGRSSVTSDISKTQLRVFLKLGVLFIDLHQAFQDQIRIEDDFMLA